MERRSNDQTRRPPPETPGGLQKSLTNYPKFRLLPLAAAIRQAAA
jgi:hypothetical protein